MPATDDTRRPFEQHRYEDTVERVLALPERDLLMVFRELTERLGQDAEVPLPVEERVDHRSAALAALQRVAEYLQLDRVARQRLTYQRYSQTAAELGLEWNAAGSVGLSGAGTTPSSLSLASLCRANDSDSCATDVRSVRFTVPRRP